MFLVLAGLLEHAMLPADISRSGLKTLLLYVYGVRLMPGHFYGRYIRFAGWQTELIWVDIAEASRFCSMVEVNIILAGCARSFRTIRTFGFPIPTCEMITQDRRVDTQRNTCYLSPPSDPG